MSELIFDILKGLAISSFTVGIGFVINFLWSVVKTVRRMEQQLVIGTQKFNEFFNDIADIKKNQQMLTTLVQDHEKDIAVSKNDIEYLKKKVG